MSYVSLNRHILTFLRQLEESLITEKYQIMLYVYIQCESSVNKQS